MIISRTPYRISFFGGGTDYPVWYRNHGGSVLGTTIDKYCYLTVRFLPPFFDHKFRIVYSKIESCLNVDEIVHSAVREILHYLKFEQGLEIHHDGDLPARSGIGSSSAFTVGLLYALHALKGEMLNKQQLAKESIYLEQEILKETVGSQDQVLAAHGGFNHIVFHSEGEISLNPVTLSPSRIQELNDHLMLFYTGITRSASEVAESYVNNIDNQKRQLRIMQDLVNEAISILGNNHDISLFGELLNEAWQIKRSLSSQVSNPQVDEVYERALSAGAIGGKLTGAGGGGFLLLFVPQASQKRVKEKLSRLLHVPFRFESLGSQIIFFDQQENYSTQIKHPAKKNQKLRSNLSLKTKTTINNLILSQVKKSKKMIFTKT